LTSGKMGIYVELWGSLIDDKDQYDQFSDNLNEDERMLLHSDFKTVNRNYAHFASKQYELSFEEIKSLSQYIQTKLEQDGLLEIFRKMENHVKAKKLEKKIV